MTRAARSQPSAIASPPRPAILITGAGGHLGGALARALAARGVRLALNDRAEEPLRSLAKELSATAVLGDITQAGEAGRIVDAARDEMGGIDGLVNNAGIEGPIGPIETMDLDDVRQVFEVNVLGMLAVTQAAVAIMRAQGTGRIVNIASGAGTAGSAWMTPYSASKHAVIGLTRSIAREVADVGISVNAVCPGCVDSPMMTRIEARLGELQGHAGPVSFVPAIPSGRYVRPDEVAAVVVWLVLDAPISVTGACEVVDGGMRA